MEKQVSGRETAVCLAPLISWNVSSSRGFGRSGKRRLHASAPNPIVQLNCMSGNRLRMLRIMAEKLAHKSFYPVCRPGRFFESVHDEDGVLARSFGYVLRYVSCDRRGVFKFISLGFNG